MRTTLLTYLTGALLFWGCANQTQPTGGPKDLDPPVVLKSTPENGALNFKGREIEMDFSEMIKLDNLQKQLIITPTIKGKYRSKIIRNKLTLIFDNPFQDSTTYTLNFRDAIKDVTESNPAKNLSLVFSTGSFLDSMAISGKVNDMLTNDPVTDYTVALFSTNDTLNIFNSIPLYATLTNKSGSYQFKNIRSGTYTLFAFNDKNGDLICQTQNEPHGAFGLPIVLDSSRTEINLSTQFLDIRELELLSSRPLGKYFEVRYNKTIVDYTVQPLTDIDTIYCNPVDNNKALRFYHTFDLDSIPIILSAKDSAGYVAIDSIYLSFPKTERPLEEFTVSIGKAQIFKSRKQFEANFTFSKPLLSINLDSAHFEFDSLSFSPEAFPFVQQWDVRSVKLTLRTQIPDSLLLFSKARFVLGKGFFISVESDSSKASTASLKLDNPENYGTVNVEVPETLHPFIIQLIDNKNNPVATTINQHQAKFEYIPAGKYKIRLFLDNNANQFWDPGNFYFKTSPEPVFFFYDLESKTNIITVKNNWILGPYLIQINVDN